MTDMHGPLLNRRQILGRMTSGMGMAALGSIIPPGRILANEKTPLGISPLGLPHHPPRAKHVIFLHQSGGPSQVDLFDYKPHLQKLHGTELSDEIRMGQRLTTMTSEQASKPLTASQFKFNKHGQSGIELSELLPYTSRVADDICVIKSLYTEAINHDPGITFIQTGHGQPGRPSMGAWITYGLGSESENLPAFVVFVSGGIPRDQPLFGRLWGSGFLPSKYHGVRFRGAADPVLYLNNPPGVDRATRRNMIDALADLDRLGFKQSGNTEVEACIEQAELAFQMQASVPDLMDLSGEPERTFDLYGPDAKKPGTYAANCLLARRLVERGVRFVQLYHRGWDHHHHLPSRLPIKCRQTDQPSAALVQDLKQRGLLDETLIVWMGEFGRTVYCQGELGSDDYGRDHHPRCFSIWMAGGGIRGGMTLGKTDDFSYNVVENGVHVHDLQATILHCLGINHERFTFRFKGRDFRLTDIGGQVVHKILA